MIDEDQRVEALEVYWAELEHSRDVIPPHSLLPELARTSYRLHSALRAPKARDEFKRQLQQRLNAELHLSSSGGPRRLRLGVLKISHRWGLVGAVAVLVLVLVGAALLTRRSHSASAQEIIRKAQTVAVAPSDAGIHSFKMTLQGEIWPARSGLGGFASITGAIRIETTYRYQVPNRWRIERSYLTMPPGQLVRDYYHAPDLEVSDGRTYTAYDASTHTVTTQHALYPGQTGIYDVAPFGIGVTDLANILRNSGRCYSPSLDGEGTVAGTSVFIVDLGASRCPSNSSHELDGRRVLWIDRTTSLVLKSVLYSVTDTARPYITVTTTEIKYGVSIPGSTFCFRAPPGRPVIGPTPVPLPLGASLSQLRHLLPFPIFVPTHVPARLKSSAPQVGAGGPPIITVNYQDGNGVDFSVVNGPAGCCLASDARKYGGATSLPGSLTAHLLNVQAAFGGPILWWEQDGTYVAVSGPHLTKDDLVKIASSMSATAVP